MRSPFPGMDPYLEQRWQDLHPQLIVQSRNVIQRQLGSGGLIASIEERVIVEDALGPRHRMGPDVRIVDPSKPKRDSVGVGVAVMERTAFEPLHIAALAVEPVIERYIEIVDTTVGGRVITVIEFVSPANKLSGESRKLYERKQNDCLDAGVNLVEIDLTRTGERRLLCQRFARVSPTDTPFQISRWKPAYGRDAVDLYRLPLQTPLPIIGIPLREGEKEALLDLQTLLEGCYVDARYDLTIRYDVPPVPALDESDAAWVKDHIKTNVSVSH